MDDRFDRWGNIKVSRTPRTKTYWYNDGKKKYFCVNPKQGAALTDVDWYIEKYVYDGGLETDSQFLVGAATSEAIINAFEGWDI